MFSRSTEQSEPQTLARARDGSPDLPAAHHSESAQPGNALVKVASGIAVAGLASILVWLVIDPAAGAGTLLASGGLIALARGQQGRPRLVAAGSAVVIGAALLGVGLVAAPKKPHPGPAGAVSSGPSLGSSTPSAATSPTLEQEKAQVRQAYLRFWEVVDRTSLSHDPTALSSVAGGQVLDYAVSALQHDRAANQTWSIKQDHNIKSITVVQGLGGPNLGAQVDDFYVDHTVLVDPKTMQPLQPDSKRAGHQSYTLQEVAPGTWKVFAGSEIH